MKIDTEPPVRIQEVKEIPHIREYCVVVTDGLPNTWIRFARRSDNFSKKRLTVSLEKMR